ncbi:MAG: DNA mismatch repair protein MutL [Dethiosulfovibrio peptidovorans]|nr:MAG: DNA mismatch repair protein MutL [Dethiosulfovibrio peptidovorans]
MKIHQLSQSVAMRIAAGEVIERPVSVIKELVENSLDAGARRIVVSTVQGGRLSMMVEDDGGGIPLEDLPLAVERHATSKILSLEDLESIDTLGYRGEALASMAAVSRLDIRSRAEGKSTGGWLRVQGGGPISVEEQNCRPGTRVQVDDLFFNLPARRKFLKSSGAELRRISRLLQELSVANPDVAFVLHSDERKVYESSGGGNRLSVLRRLWGDEPPVSTASGAQGPYRVTVWWQRLASSRISLMAFVNGRRIDDGTIRAAVSSGETHPGGNWAVWIETAPSEVDVNVHPAKAEVLFRRGSDLFAAVREAAASMKNDCPVWFDGNTSRSPTDHAPLQVASPSRYAAPPRGESLFRRIEPFPATESHQLFEPTEKESHPSVKRDTPPSDALPSPVYMGQLTSGYLLFDDRGDLILIDPHAAHERINFETIRERCSKGYGSQLLAVPIELPPTLSSEAEPKIDELHALAFSLDTNDGRTVLRGIPDIPKGASIPPLDLLRTTLIGLAEENQNREVIWLRWATVACRSSVKLTWSLTPEEAQVLWQRLLLCDTPSACPHGRPALFRLRSATIAAHFERR